MYIVHFKVKSNFFLHIFIYPSSPLNISPFFLSLHKKSRVFNLLFKKMQDVRKGFFRGYPFIRESTNRRQESWVLCPVWIMIYRMDCWLWAAITRLSIYFIWMEIIFCTALMVTLVVSLRYSGLREPIFFFNNVYKIIFI